MIATGFVSSGSGPSSAALSSLSFRKTASRAASFSPSWADFLPPAAPTPSNPSTNRSGSKSRRSSIPSPTPTNFTGSPSSLLTATTLPPRALPSSLVRIRPVNPTSSSQILAESNAILPCAASMTSNVSWGTSGFGIGLPSALFSRDNRSRITRFISTNSSVRSKLLLRRPDVSTRTTSYFSFSALVRAPSRTCGGVLSGPGGTKQSTSARSAHNSS
mmetsp:Transcript_15297/g.35154  ORF Transcript_15297/g.35154 Transcript_15297/m.35154 type:complete len:217 (-) Transcript_15297:22-672(-)